ncbi:MAG: molecular chaperone HtpG [Alphaproteobacteria bacterium 41-28]|nr:MAG: molecular chaperone HtpG [Alphaproteobacteria bacterium 41-28]
MSEYTFQAEVSKLLQLVTHHLYSNKEIFFRELISNASDACDKLRHLLLTNSDLAEKDIKYKITLAVDEDAKTLIIEDNGIGMTRQELIASLGTIAKSGTAQFLQKLTGDTKKDTNLIGQYGIGFYTCFMVASEVEVISLRAGKKEAHKWTSNGIDSFSVERGKLEHHGTKIILYLKEDAQEYLSPLRLKSLVEKYSEHIAFSIVLNNKENEEVLNEELALWLLPKKEITPEQYKSFYQHVSHTYDEPWFTLHTKAEGIIEYAALLFIPSNRPVDLFNAERRNRLKLYIKRVFITDDCENLFPSYLRFVRGIVDTEDLPLNISRETLQFDPRMSKIKSSLTKKVLDSLTKKAKEDSKDYLKFWQNFGAILKEGFYEEFAKEEELLFLVRVKSTLREGYISLEDYVTHMKDDQKEIFYLLGDDLSKMLKSPQLEGFHSHKLNVLLLSDPIDHFWVSQVYSYKDRPFKSVTEEDLNLNTEKSGDSHLKSLIEFLEKHFQGKVKKVRISTRLKESPVCFVSSRQGQNFYLTGFIQEKQNTLTRILEINPNHQLIQNLLSLIETEGTKKSLEEMADLLYDQALILEGLPVTDSQLFAQRLTSLMSSQLNAV